MNKRKGFIFLVGILIAVFFIFGAVVFISVQGKASVDTLVDDHILPAIQGSKEITIKSPEQFAKFLDCVSLIKRATENSPERRAIEENEFNILEGTGMDGCTVIGRPPKLFKITFIESFILPEKLERQIVFTGLLGEPISGDKYGYPLTDEESYTEEKKKLPHVIFVTGGENSGEPTKKCLARRANYGTDVEINCQSYLISAEMSADFRIESDLDYFELEFEDVDALKSEE